jgi:hypothetical protein
MIPIQAQTPSSPLSPQSVSPLRLLSEGDRALLDATVLPPRIPPLVLGEMVNARVAEQLGDNQVAVLIKSALFTLTLPPGLQLKSDNLSLRVTSLKPGLTFALSESDQPGEHADASVDVTLSPASRYLTRLLSSARQDDAGGAGSQSGKSGVDSHSALDSAERLSGKETVGSGGLKAYDNSGSAGGRALLATLDSHASSPLTLDAMQQPPGQLAEALKHGVEHSGLFYESHLKAWEQGKLPLADLLHEPQAKIGQALLQGAESGGAHAVTADLGTLVQRQLNTLETQQLPLQGVAWPGQPVQMLIEQEKTDERQARGEQDTTAWSTSLALNLPVLGGVSARLRMVGQAVQVSFVTEESATRELIQRHVQRLDDGLAAAGLSLANLSVKQE